MEALLRRGAWENTMVRPGQGGLHRAASRLLKRERAAGTRWDTNLCGQLQIWLRSVGFTQKKKKKRHQRVSIWGRRGSHWSWDEAMVQMKEDRQSPPCVQDMCPWLRPPSASPASVWKWRKKSDQIIGGIVIFHNKFLMPRIERRVPHETADIRHFESASAKRYETSHHNVWHTKMTPNEGRNLTQSSLDVPQVLCVIW